MKKVFAILLAAALVATMSIAASAAVTTVPGSADAQDLKVNYTSLTENDDTVYSIDVNWTDMAFAYTAGSEAAWNPETHEYAVSGAQWTDKTAAVKVTNHSNADVVVDIEIANETGFTVTDDQDGAQTLDAGVENKPNEADNVTFTLTVDDAGVPTADQQLIAKATVKISAAGI